MNATPQPDPHRRVAYDHIVLRQAIPLARRAVQLFRRVVINSVLPACVAALLISVLCVPAQAQGQLASAAEGAYFANDYPAKDVLSLGDQQMKTLRKLEQLIIADVENIVLEDALHEIARHVDLELIYADWDVLQDRIVSLPKEPITALSAFYEVVRGTGLSFKIAPGGYLLVLNEPARVEPKAPSEALSLPLIMVTGEVTSADDGLPLPGVNVVVKGTNVGTVTDIEGRYTIDAPEPQDTLVFSFVGYQRTEVPIADRSTIDVAMAVSAEELEEVVVIGYGEKSRRLMTESISTATAEEISKISVASPEMAISGRLSGVQVTQAGGAPGMGTAVRIRGVGTIGTSQPLYVVDGVPIGKGFTQTGGGERRESNPLNTINPSDIESISVLKDASAAAVYGVRAANGVVLITTKRGARGNPRINIESSVGVQNLRDHYDFVSTDEYISLLQESFDNFNTQMGLSSSDDQFRRLPPDLQQGSAIRNIDNSDAWREEFVRSNAPVSKVNLSVSGATNALNYFISGNYYNEEATTIEYGLERFSFRANSDYQIGDWLRVGESFTVGHSNQKWGLNFDNYGSVLSMPSFFSVYDENNEIPNNRYGYHGNRNRAGLVIDNPLLPANLDIHSIQNTRLNGSLYAEITPFPRMKALDGLTFKSQVATDNIWGDQLLVATETTAEELGRASSDRTQWGKVTEHVQIYTNTLTYDTQVGAHSLSTLGGFEYQYIRNGNVGGEGSDFLSQDPAFRRNPQSAQSLTFASGLGEQAYVGWFGRASYDYKEKYLLTGTIRRDGSSIFNPAGGRQWGTFPSFSAAWRLSEEPFFDVPFISELKLRGSWGQLGNDQTLPYGHLFLVSTTPDYTLNGNETVQGAVPQSFVNEDVTWETVETWDAGLDISLFNNRLDILGTYYRRLTRDFLIDVPIPMLSGFIIGEGTTSAPVNAGTVMNEGFELEVGYVMTPMRDLTLDFSANLTTVTNELQELTRGVEEFLDFGGFRTAVGFPIGYMYGYRTDGIYQNQAEADAALPDVVNGGRQPQPGDVRFVDVNGDGEITTDDRTFLGQPQPDAYFGFNVGAQYGNWDLSVFLQGAVGHSMINRYRQQRLNLSDTGRNVLADIKDRWTPQNPSNDMPRVVASDPNANWRLSDLVVDEADLLRVRNIQLGWTLPEQWVGAVSRRARVYLNATNVFLFTKYKGLDPETVGRRHTASPIGKDFDEVQGGTAFDPGRLPSPRTFEVGVQLQF